MRTVHFSDARNNLKAVIDQAIADHDAILITRRDAPNAVIMSQEQYDSWMETMYLLSSPANAERLLRSIEQHRRGEGVERELIDPDAA
ncbi:prevent-host-death protein [Cupriavidus sp. USMAA2-4]|uniref:Antitoxin n=1 Tax=Cupriavidus malaysiensis TaxID=367825 RepID=A0ABN4TV87_9BURK|nr:MULTISPECIES: type II toxin-antitoxin system prevent-host-death family antitoxin [Cupriavidus]AOY94890.1 prevent-host-death protein [Cupriavidus sp. USMAA2-4]AOZ02233.1 prevent-host-death protein [Cupriavidus sp. USMAHM13]AOZ10389.1 prevent-host-death protein [Cupriavidus malaysiensis]